jgi:hypothetical protein
MHPELGRSFSEVAGYGFASNPPYGLIQLKFGIYIDQSYLPTIVQQIESEFPAPHRASFQAVNS